MQHCWDRKLWLTWRLHRLTLIIRVCHSWCRHPSLPLQRQQWWKRGKQTSGGGSVLQTIPSPSDRFETQQPVLGWDWLKCWKYQVWDNSCRSLEWDFWIVLIYHFSRKRSGKKGSSPAPNRWCWVDGWVAWSSKLGHHQGLEAYFSKLKTAFDPPSVPRFQHWGQFSSFWKKYF